MARRKPLHFLPIDCIHPCKSLRVEKQVHISGNSGRIIHGD
jgi:hypothetical protein